ncbi:acyl-CoA thioesterase [Paenibacillus hamazuiensis]|uniref:acyl-CoA thioesterase n=1 Tax=Paenibacillus hamazuiensis TaxID=2936508 RepID=UPI00200E908E|nr:thioesterase family protein [Paenibacillus hamazuiensis]
MWHKHIIRVRYQETDQMGVVYHANYLNWFEIGRTELIRAMGMTYQTIEASGLLLPVIEAEMKFRQPARYDDLIGIYTRIVSFTNLRLEFATEIRRLTPEEAAAQAGRHADLPSGTNGSKRLKEAEGAPNPQVSAPVTGKRSTAGGGEDAAAGTHGEAVNEAIHAAAMTAPITEPQGELLVSGGTRHVWLSREWKPARIDREAPELYALLAQNRNGG